MNIQQRLSPNRNVGRQGSVPDFIVCHITESSSLSGAVSWLMNAEAQVSYHFVVARDGQVIQFVDIENTAWGNGTTNSGDSRDNRHSAIAAVRERRVNANRFTVSIGFEGRSTVDSGRFTDKQVEVGAELIRHIRSEVKRIYGFDIPLENVVRHSDITPRWKPHCPGVNFPMNEIITRLKAAPPEPQAAEWAAEAWAWATENGITDGTRPADVITRQEAMTLLHRFWKYIRV